MVPSGPPPKAVLALACHELNLQNLSLSTEGSKSEKKSPIYLLLCPRGPAKLASFIVRRRRRLHWAFNKPGAFLPSRNLFQSVFNSTNLYCSKRQSAGLGNKGNRAQKNKSECVQHTTEANDFCIFGRVCSAIPLIYFIVFDRHHVLKT